MSDYFPLTTVKKTIVPGTGTGTQEDPFVVGTFSDLRVKMSVTGSYIKLASDLDYNSESGYWTGVSTSFTELDLDGHTLKNIDISPTENNYFFINTNTAEDCIVKNGTIQSVIGSNLVYFTSNDQGCNLYMTGVKLSGIFTQVGNSAFFSTRFSTSNTYLTRCSLNINVVKLTSTSSAFSNSNDMIVDCDICIDYRGLVGIGGTFVNSKLTGSYHCINADIASSVSLLYSGASSVIACNISSAGCKIKLSSYASGVNIADNNLISSTLDSTPSAIKLLTTEQCKSADYLNSIGFTVLEG